MLIGFDASRAFTGQNTGTENYSLNLLKALAKVDRKNHYRVYLRSISDLSALSDLRDLKSKPNFEFKIVRPNRLWTQIGLALETWKAPVDVLFVPAHTLPILRNYRVKTVVTMHDLGVEYLPNYHKFPQRYYLDFASKFAAKSADCLIAVSNSTKQDLITRYGVSSGKIKVVYEGVDSKFFSRQPESKVESVKKKYRLADRYFLYVGTVQPRKNLMFLIDTFNAFVKSYSVKGNNLKDINVNLVIAGKMGWDYDEIVALPKKLRIEKRVKLLGFVPSADLPALYSGAQALLFPSLFEGFGLPILEALSSGCPVIASDINVHREVFHAITTGYKNHKVHATGSKLTKSTSAKAMMLAKPKDKRQWLGFMDQITNFPIQSIAKEGLPQFLGESFGWDQVAKQTIMVLNGVI